MARRRKGEAVSGWINLDKTYDLTSTHAVSRVRRAFNAQTAGHAGTLDPLATGILPIALGEATKTVPVLVDADKAYRFTIAWGRTTATYDREGETLASSDVRPTPDQVAAVLPRFTGEISQVPPAYSAIKVNGENYDSVMTDLGLTDQEVADVMNYIFTAWDNNIGPAVTVEEVEGI